jgi:Ca2+/Na+ antiporter
MEIIGALIVLGAAVVVAAHNHTEKKPALDRFAFFSFFLICTLL